MFDSIENAHLPEIGLAFPAVKGVEGLRMGLDPPYMRGPSENNGQRVASSRDRSEIEVLNP